MSAPTPLPTWRGFVPTIQPTGALSQLNYMGNFVTGGLALFCAVVSLMIYFLFGFIHQIGFFRFTRMTRPSCMIFMSAYQSMTNRLQRKLQSTAHRNEPKSALRAALFLFGSMFAVGIAGPVLFVYLSIGIFFQAMLIYRTFPLSTDPLNSTSNFLEFIRLWWSTIIRYIVPTQRNTIGPEYASTIATYDTTVIYAPMLTAFDWLVNLKVDFSMALRGVVCQGAYVAPLELLLNVVIVLVLIIVIEGDYCMLFGPVMNGTYDKYMERMYRDKGYGSKCRAFLSIFLCVLYRVIDLPTHFTNALQFLSTLIATRVFFLAGGGWRHWNTVVCDSIVFTKTGVSRQSNVDYGMSIVTTLCFYLLVFLTFTVGSKVVFPQLFIRLNMELARGNDPDGKSSDEGKSGRRARARERMKQKTLGNSGNHRGRGMEEHEVGGSGEWGRELFASPDSRSGSPTFNSSQALMEAGGIGGGGVGPGGRPRSAGKSVAFTDADHTNIDTSNANDTTTLGTQAIRPSPSSSTRSHAKTNSPHQNHPNDDNDNNHMLVDPTAPPPPSPYAFGCALPDPLRFIYFACSADILIVQLLCAFGWCVFGRWGCCDKGACCDRTFGECCQGCECEDNPDWNDYSSVHTSPPRAGSPNTTRTRPPSPPIHHTSEREGTRAFTAVSPLSPTLSTTTPNPSHSQSKSSALQLAPLSQQQHPQSSGGRARSSSDPGTRARPSPPLHVAFYFEYILPQNTMEKKALLTLESRPHFFAENLFDVLYNWSSFGKAALGWWGEDSLDCLVERKLRKMRLDPLLDDGYAGDILSAIMKPRAAYLRLFPYCSPAALMVYQMASTPTCFLLYPRHTPSPLFDKLQLAILHCKDGVTSNETDQWPTVVYWPLHLLSDNGSYIAKIIWNILLTGLPLGIAFIPTNKWWMFLPIAIILVICMAAIKALLFVIALGKFIGVRDGDFDLLFCRKTKETTPTAGGLGPTGASPGPRANTQMDRRIGLGLGSLGDGHADDDDLEDLHSHISMQSSSVSTGAASGATPLTPAHWGGSGNGSVGVSSRAPSPPTGQHPLQQAAVSSSPGPPTTPQEGPSNGLPPSPFAAAAAISTMAVAVAVAALNSADRERERERERIERELFEREGYAARRLSTPVKISRHNSDGSLLLTPREKRAYSSSSPALRNSSDRSSSTNNSPGSSSVKSGSRGRGMGVTGGNPGGSLLSDLVKAADHDDEDDDDSEEENIITGSGKGSTKTKGMGGTIPTTIGSHPSFFIPSPQVVVNDDPRRGSSNNNDEDDNNQLPSFTVTRVVPLEQLEHDADGKPGAPSTPMDNIPPPTPGSGARPPLTFSLEPTEIVPVSAYLSAAFEPVSPTPPPPPPPPPTTTAPSPPATTVAEGEPATAARDVTADVPPSITHVDPPLSSSSSPVFLITALSQPANAGDQRVQVASHEGCQSGMVVRLSTGDGDGNNNDDNVGTPAVSEVRQIIGFGSLILDAPLINSYPAGAKVEVFQAVNGPPLTSPPEPATKPSTSDITGTTTSTTITSTTTTAATATAVTTAMPVVDATTTTAATTTTTTATSSTLTTVKQPMRPKVRAPKTPLAPALGAGAGASSGALAALSRPLPLPLPAPVFEDGSEEKESPSHLPSSSSDATIAIIDESFPPTQSIDDKQITADDSASSGVEGMMAPLELPDAPIPGLVQQLQPEVESTSAVVSEAKGKVGAAPAAGPSRPDLTTVTTATTLATVNPPVTSPQDVLSTPLTTATIIPLSLPRLMPLTSTSSSSSTVPLSVVEAAGGGTHRGSPVSLPACQPPLRVPARLPSPSSPSSSAATTAISSLLQQRQQSIKAATPASNNNTTAPTMPAPVLATNDKPPATGPSDPISTTPIAAAAAVGVDAVVAITPSDKPKIRSIKDQNENKDKDTDREAATTTDKTKSSPSSSSSMLPSGSPVLPFEAIPPIRWRDGTITEVDDAPGQGLGVGKEDGKGLGTTSFKPLTNPLPTPVRMPSALSKSTPAVRETPSSSTFPLPSRDLSPEDLTRLNHRVEALEEEKKRIKARLLSQGLGPKGVNSPHPAATATVGTVGSTGSAAVGGGGGTGPMKVTHEILRVDVRRQNGL